MAIDPVTPLVRSRGAEFGVRTVRIPRIHTTASLWVLGFDSELLFVGDAGTTEAGRPSRRVGLEVTNYVRVSSWVTADVDVSFSRARFRGIDPAGDHVPGALDRVVSAGLSVSSEQTGPFGSVRLRHFGPRPLIEDNSVRSKQTALINGEIGYELSNGMRLILEGFNLFDSKVADIDYFYTSRLPGEPASGVDDVHTHPVLPRSARVTVQFRF
jgi:hypothetical protein